jgi:hypothetical protein
MPMEFSPNDLANDPSLLLHGIDFQNGRARLFQIEPELPNDNCGRLRYQTPFFVPLESLLDIYSTVETQCAASVHFIWMSDYCGSTLYAKALNEVDGLYLYNETNLFFDIANAKRLIDNNLLPVSEEKWRLILAVALFFQRKTFAPNDIALVKEWPVSNYILNDILDMNESSRGIFLYAPLSEYLTSCLKMQARRNYTRDRVTNILIETRNMAPFEGINPGKLSDAQIATMHWLYLMYQHDAQRHNHHPQLRTLFNGEFYSDPGRILQRSATHFGRTLTASDAMAITKGPVFRRHSKNSTQAFTMDDHQSSLASARHRFKAEIDDGLSWAESILSVYPLPEHPGIGLLAD